MESVPRVCTEILKSGLFATDGAACASACGILPGRDLWPLDVLVCRLGTWRELLTRRQSAAAVGVIAHWFLVLPPWGR